MRPEIRRPNAPHTQEGGRMLIDNAPALLRAAADVMNITPDDITGKRKTFAEALDRKSVV